MAFQVSYRYELSDNVTEALKNIRKQLLQVETSFRNVGTKSVEDVSKLTKKLDAVEKSMTKIGTKARNVGAVMSAAITAPIALLSKNMAIAGINVGEQLNKFNVVFDGIKAKATETSEGLRDFYGLGNIEAKQLLADTGDILASMGFTKEESLKLSEAVIKLGVDLTSFTNFSQGAGRASVILTKALLGEREALEGLGKKVTEEEVKDKITALQEAGVQFKTLQQAKAIAGLQILYEKSTNAIGDYAKTSQMAAARLRLVSVRAREAREAFGVIMLPFSTKVIESILKFLETMRDLDPAIKKVILTIGGLLAALAPVILTLGTIILSLRILKIAFIPLVSKIGLLTIAIGVLVGAFAYLFSFLRKNPQFLKITTAIGAATASIGFLILAMKNFAVVTSILKIVAAGFAFLISPIGLIATAVIGVIGLVVLFRDKGKEAFSILANKAKKLLEPMQKLLDAFKSIGERIKELSLKPFSKISESFKGIKDKIKGFSGDESDINLKDSKEIFMNSRLTYEMNNLRANEAVVAATESKAQILVDFQNVPIGTQIEQTESPKSNIDLGTNQIFKN